LKSLGLDVGKVAERVTALIKVPVEALWAVGKHRETAAAYSLLCFWPARQLGLSMSSLPRRSVISPASQPVIRCEVLAN
jgi:hypothetical protein